MPDRSKSGFRTIYFYILLAFFVVGLPVLILYSVGYRFDSELGLVKRGGVYISVPLSGAEVSLNGEFQRETGFFTREIFIQNVNPGEHDILVFRPDYIPWSKRFLVEPQTVSTLFPFLLPREYQINEIQRLATSTSPQTGGVVATTSEEYLSISNFFISRTSSSTAPLGFIEKDNARVAVEATTTLATTSILDYIPENLRVSNGSTIIWHSDFDIYAYWQDSSGWLPPRFCNQFTCKNLMLVASSAGEINHIDFYPGRDDVIIYSVEDGVYVVEIDKRPVQIHERIIFGEDVTFRIVGNRIFIKDGKEMAEIIID